MVLLDLTFGFVSWSGLPGEKGEKGSPGVGTQGPRGLPGLPGKQEQTVFTRYVVLFCV